MLLLLFSCLSANLPKKLSWKCCVALAKPLAPKKSCCRLLDLLDRITSLQRFVCMVFSRSPLRNLEHPDSSVKSMLEKISPKMFS